VRVNPRSRLKINFVWNDCSRAETFAPGYTPNVKRAQECRELQDKLVGDRLLTAERAEEITKTMDRTGCTAQLPAH
jgi:hypothetical protein